MAVKVFCDLCDAQAPKHGSTLNSRRMQIPGVVGKATREIEVTPIIGGDHRGVWVCNPCLVAMLKGAIDKIEAL